MRWRHSFSTNDRLLSRGPLNIDFTTQALRGGWGFPTPPPRSSLGQARKRREGFVERTSLPITPASSGPSLGQTQERRVGYTHPPLDTHRCANLRLTTLLPRFQPRPDPGERNDIQRWRRLTVAQLNLRIKKNRSLNSAAA